MPPNTNTHKISPQNFRSTLPETVEGGDEKVEGGDEKVEEVDMEMVSNSAASKSATRYVTFTRTTPISMSLSV